MAQRLTGIEILQLFGIPVKVLEQNENDLEKQFEAFENLYNGTESPLLTEACNGVR